MKKLACVALSISAVLFSCNHTDSLPSPNVVLIISEQQTLDVDKMMQEDNSDLTKWLRRGAILSDFHINPSVEPTVTSVLTGRYAQKIKMNNDSILCCGLPREVASILDVFESKNYLTSILSTHQANDNTTVKASHSYGNPIDQQIAQKMISLLDNSVDQELPFFAYVYAAQPNREETVCGTHKGTLSDDSIKPTCLLTISKLLEQYEIIDNTIFVSVLLPKSPHEDMETSTTRGIAYEQHHRAQCFIHWPDGDIKSGLDIQQLTAHIDLYPTLLELANISIDTLCHLDGVSLKPALLGKQQEISSRTIVIDSQCLDRDQKWKDCATMQGSWRLINGSELYNVASDPEQKHDLKIHNPEIFKRLTAAYDAWWLDSKDVTRVDQGS